MKKFLLIFAIIVDLRALHFGLVAELILADAFFLDKLVEHNLDLDISYPALSKELIDKLHQNDIEVNCWTTDTAETAEKLMEWGVDYLTTNILEQN